MQTIHYNRSKLTVSTLFCLIVCPVLGIVLYNAGGFRSLVGLLILIAGPIAGLGTMRMLLGDAVAIRYDQRSAMIFTMWKAHSLSWAEVVNVQIMTHTVRMYGLIPVKRSHFIDFRVHGGLLGTRKVRLPFRLLGLNKAAGAALVAELNLVRMAADDGETAHGTQAYLKRTNRFQDAPQADVFDPDAVIARHIANRSHLEQLSSPMPSNANNPSSNLPSRARGFGRKGL